MIETGSFVVFVKEYLDTLQKKLDRLEFDSWETLRPFLCLCSLLCLYCERTFRDQATLRDHMRKKQHRKVNPQNKAYDKFYLINYLV